MISYFSNVRSGLAAYRWADLRGDAYGGITTGILMLPISMGFGVMTGLGPVAGLHGSIAVGLFSAIFGGIRGLIVGPNIFAVIAMAIIVTKYTTTIGEALTAAMLAGVIQIILGMLKFGRYMSYMPYSLLAGFFTAAGILLILTQIMPALGQATMSGDVADNIDSWIAAVQNTNSHALLLVIISIAIGFLWPARLAKFLPATFVVLLVGTVLGVVWLRDAPVVGAVPSGWPEIQMPVFSAGLLIRVLEPAFVMALMNTISSLMLSLVIEPITGVGHKPNQQTISIGLGNIIASLFGGMVGAGSYATLNNLRSGGRSPLSGVLAASVLVAAAFGLGPMLGRIPLAVLAGIIIKVGWDLIDWRFIARSHLISRGYVLVMLATTAVAVLVDFVTAILIGIALSHFINARRAERFELRRLISVPLLDREILPADEADPFEARSGLIVFPDRISVASAREVVRIVRQDIGQNHISIFDLSRTEYVDDTAAMIIGQLIDVATDLGTRRFIIAGLQPEVTETLKSMKILDSIPASNFVANLDEAKLVARPMLASFAPVSSE